MSSIMSLNGSAIERVTDMKVGEIVTFGNYVQSTDPAKGPEKIEWVVLEVEEHRALLLSRYVPDAIPFIEKLRRVPWKGCTLRKWMNNEFYKKAFSPSERSLILETKLKNKDFLYVFRTLNTDTTDRIFPLSLEEQRRYSAIEPAQFAEPTPYARNKGIKKIDCISVDEAFYDKNLKAKNISKDIIGRTIACWWVRSNSDGWKTADRSWVVGVLGNGNSVYLPDVGVRPALYVGW